jgi:thiol:disulfide interchange protein DsbC
MIRKLFILLILVLAMDVRADEASLRKAIESAYPKMSITSISKTPYPGIYEVFMGGQLVYTDEKFSFLIAEGHLVDTKTKRDLTGDRLHELSKIDFAKLPLDLAIKVVKGNGNRKLAVFSDPDCPFCKKLEQNELTNINDVTIYTFLLPIDRLHPDAANKSKAIWCATDRSKAWEDWIIFAQLPKHPSTSCDTPLEKIAAFAKKYNISSTPTLFFADGSRLEGAYPSEEIETALNAAKR